MDRIEAILAQRGPAAASAPTPPGATRH
jgi:hypothetical protein